MLESEQSIHDEPELYYKTQSWKVFAQTQLPFLPTPMEAIEKIFDFLEKKHFLKKNQKLVDLGAGDGRVIIFAAEKYRIHSVGVEVNLSMIESAQNVIKQKKLRELCNMVEGDLYDFEISDADLVFSFALPQNHRFFRRIIEKIKEGAYFISVRHDLDQYQEYWSEKYEINIEGTEFFKSYVYKKGTN